MPPMMPLTPKEASLVTRQLKSLERVEAQLTRDSFSRGSVHSRKRTGTPSADPDASCTSPWVKVSVRGWRLALPLPPAPLTYRATD